MQVRPWDYRTRRGGVEALLAVPEGEGPFPAVVYVHGHPFDAVSSLPAAWHLAGAGLACLLVSQPGYGRSQGPPDYCGPRTLRAILEGVRRLDQEPAIDVERLGLWGFSRGAIVSGGLIARCPARFRAAVLQSGGYDLRRAGRQSRDPDFRANLARETGGRPAALAARSLIVRVDSVRCPVLLVHGQADPTFPLPGARELARRLASRGLLRELVVLPGEHDLPWPAVARRTVPFLATILGVGRG